jgi:hypothetical protein
MTNNLLEIFVEVIEKTIFYHIFSAELTLDKKLNKSFLAQLPQVTYFVDTTVLLPQ